MPKQIATTPAPTVAVASGSTYDQTFDEASLKAFNAFTRIHQMEQQNQNQQQRRFAPEYTNHHQSSNHINHILSNQQQQTFSTNQLDNNNNSIFLNNKFNQTQLNSSLGGVINNLINSSLVTNNNNAASNQSSTSSAAAAAATAYLLNNPSGLTSANLILANFNQQQQQHQQNQQYVDESKCHVCGDKSTGSHFGGISCESCKAFFRRSVQKNRFEDYKCSYSGECKMNTNTRKICQFCRYKTCLGIGMRPKWVLSDDERHQKYGNRRKNKVKVEAESAPALPTLNRTESKTSVEVVKDEEGLRKTSTQSSNTDDEATNIDQPQTPVKNDVSKLGIDGINMRPNSLNLNSYEKDLIDRLSIAFYHSRKFNSIDLNVQKKLAVLFQTQSEGSLKKMSKVILANFIVQPVKRVITFAKLIPDFRKLDINDQMSLLQGGSMEIFICSSTSLYDQMSNKFMNLVSKDRNIQGNDSSNIQLDILRLIWSEDVFEKTINYLKSMSELKLDEATLILFLPLILFSPDRRDIKDRQKVYSIQSKYSFLLKKYMIWKYGLNQNTTKTYNKLLLKLVELRTLHEMHSSILLDADPSQLEPFSLALISKEKEEAIKIKSVVDQTTRSADTPMSPSAQSPAQTTLEDKGDSINHQIKSVNQFDGSLSILTPASSSYGQIPSLSSVSSPLSNMTDVNYTSNSNGSPHES